MSRQLVFNADDYGLCPGVSLGVLEASRGVVRSTTVLANLADTPALQALGMEGLGCGVHLNLSCGLPLSPDYPEALLSGGNFDKSQALAATTWQDGRWLAAVEAEWRLQHERLQRAGLELDHLDSHHHVHLLPTLFPLALKLAAEWGLALRSRSNEQHAQCRAARVPTPDSLVEGFFGAGNISVGRLLELLDATTGAVVEVMCHPGIVDDTLRGLSSYVDERAAELDVLGDELLQGQLEAAGWSIGGYRW
jgi:chitin disaccharide deacetylase